MEKKIDDIFDIKIDVKALEMLDEELGWTKEKNEKIKRGLEEIEPLFKEVRDIYTPKVTYHSTTKTDYWFTVHTDDIGAYYIRVNKETGDLFEGFFNDKSIKDDPMSENVVGNENWIRGCFDEFFNYIPLEYKVAERETYYCTLDIVHKM